MRSLKDELRHFKGQPIEIVMDSGFKICGIDVESDESSVSLIDDDGRMVRVENRHIDVIIEPKMRLDRLCVDNDCDCDNRRRRDCEYDD